MIEATNLKAGTTFLMDGKPYKVVKYTHQKIARGGGTVKLSIRNLRSGKLEEKILSSSSKVEGIATIKKPLQFLYKDSDVCVFMNSKTYEQIEIPLNLLEESIQFIKEGEIVNVLFFDNKALSVEIPTKVVLEVTETVPGVKGDSATNVYKPATLENGLQLKVPLFIKKGDRIKVDTRKGEYVERIK
jgi:elongation factor P